MPQACCNVRVEADGNTLVVERVTENPIVSGWAMCLRYSKTWKVLTLPCFDAQDVASDIDIENYLKTTGPPSKTPRMSKWPTESSLYGERLCCSKTNVLQRMVVCNRWTVQRSNKQSVPQTSHGLLLPVEESWKWWNNELFVGLLVKVGRLSLSLSLLGERWKCRPSRIARGSNIWCRV